VDCGTKRIHGEGCTGYYTRTGEWHDSSPDCKVLAGGA
jgi:hypothetical protein